MGGIGPPYPAYETGMLPLTSHGHSSRVCSRGPTKHPHSLRRRLHSGSHVSHCSGISLPWVNTYLRVADMLGTRGSDSRFILASVGVLSPLRLLHVEHAVTMLRHVVSPPLERGWTWSKVRSRCCRFLPQY